MTTPKKKLIEVALPLEAINKASVRENYIYRGNPSALHKWWAQRPLAAARAVLFAQMVDDPSACPDEFPTETAQATERQRLFSIIEQLIQWESTTDTALLSTARAEITKSWRRGGKATAAKGKPGSPPPDAQLPPFYDPFSGAGTLPLEAQRLGLDPMGSDLNPVAVLISKGTTEYPALLGQTPPVNLQARSDLAASGEWARCRGLAEDVRYYGNWIRCEAEKRIGHLYPHVKVSQKLAAQRPELKPLVGRELPVIAWLWARTVRSPNPAFANVEVPLVSSFMVSTKKGKEVYVHPVVNGGGYTLELRTGVPEDVAAAKNGTRAGKAQDFVCLLSGVPIPRTYIREEGKAGRLGSRLMAVVVEAGRGRTYLPAECAEGMRPLQNGESRMVEEARATFLAGATPTRAMITGGVCSAYGLVTWGHLFTPRQLVALVTLSDLIAEARERVRSDASRVALPKEASASTYADAVATYLAFAVDKAVEYNCTLVPWYSKEDRPKGVFARQAIPMVWDYAEVNPLSNIGGSFSASVEIVAGALDGCCADGRVAKIVQADATKLDAVNKFICSTDPPYYDNIGYGDLSDFFYGWLRRTLRPQYPGLFETVVTPKAEELTAALFRHGTKEKAEAFFLAGMTEVMRRLAAQAHPDFPVTIYYAFKQSEAGDDAGAVSTGWETFLEAVIRAGFALTGTWPIRTERGARSVAMGANALASSIVLVCRPRTPNAPTATRREFVAALKSELPGAVAHLQRGNIAPVDLAQAAIGPGMGVFTRYDAVLAADGTPLLVRDALKLINETLDEVLTEQEGDFDPDTRWALAWFEQVGFGEGEYGVAETLSKAKNTSVRGLQDAGILKSSKGKVRLLKASEMRADWDPTTDNRLVVWEMVHHLARALDGGGEVGAASIVAQLGAKAEVARELAYRLYNLCERKRRAPEALAYNGLVQSWPEITRLARDGGKPVRSAQAALFDRDEE